MTAARSAAAYRIETERTVLRCWQPRDAEPLQRAIAESLDHLRPWMPWAAGEPSAVEEKVRLLRRWRAAFDRDEEYVYGIFPPDEQAIWGGAGLHKRLPGNALEIGYWIHAARINRGLATEIAAALCRVAFDIHAVDRVEVHCDPANARSAAIPRKLGCVQEAILRRRAENPDGSPRDVMLWTLFREAYPNSPAASTPIKAFDATDSEIPLSAHDSPRSPPYNAPPSVTV